jgi:hypothetical protein
MVRYAWSERRGRGTRIERSTLRAGLRRWVYALKCIVARYPSVAIPLARWRGRNYPIGPDTEIVIECFPRSASSFAVCAFESSQPFKPRVAHHVHAPAQVIAAARAGIPALVLIRRPEEAILSMVIREPWMRLRDALLGFIRFYEPLIPQRDGFLVATFQEVVTDFGPVIDRINCRFGTTFHRFEHTPENVRGCLDRIDRRARRRWPAAELENLVARPSETRDRLKERLRPAYRHERLAPLRHRAEALYLELTADRD